MAKKEEKKEPEEQKAREQKTEKNFMDYHYDCVKPEEIERRSKVIASYYETKISFTQLNENDKTR